MTILESYKANEFIYFSCDIQTYHNKNNKLKKQLIMPCGWSKFNSIQYDDSKNGICILTGKTSNLFVVDYDSKQLFKDDIKLYPELLNYYVKTKNGYHSYFRWNEITQNELTSSTDKIDFQGNGKCIIAPPSKYVDSTKKYKYKLKANNEIKYMSDELRIYLINKYIKQQENKVVETSDLDKEIIRLGETIDIKYLDNYKSWIKIIWALKSKNLYEEAKQISKRSKKYDDKGFDSAWNSYQEGKISLNTFHYYVKLSNNQKYNEIRQEYHNFNELDLQTDDDIAKVFVKLYGMNYIYNDKIVYYFNGIYWQSNGNNKLKIDISEGLRNFYLDEYKKRIKNNDTQDNKILNLLKKIGNYRTQDNIYHSILKYIEVDNLEWETNPYLYVFKNKIYDLKNNSFIEPSRDDYMTLNTNYEYIEPTEDQIKFLEDVVEKIFPKEDERKLYMTLLCSGMIGKTLEKFINANGSGGNGKGMLNELFYLMSGEYAYNCTNDVLLSPLKQGNNVDVANMSYKRIIFYREPDTTNSKKLNISTIKELTGGNEISATKKYSNNTKCVLYGTHIIECNDRPKISGKIDNATIRRLIDVPFRSTFTKDVDDCCAEYVYKGDDYLKTNDFKNKYKCALFQILMPYMKAYIDSNENIDSFICDSVKKRTNEYLEGCDEVLNFFNENYKKSEDKTKELKVKDVYDNFRQSDIYLNMNKAEKRALNYSKFTDEIKTNIFLRKYYKERKGNIRNLIIGWEQIENDEEDGSEDELNKLL